MEVNCRVLSMILVCFCLTLQHVSGATWRGKGCGANRKEGDQWFLKQCAVCRCMENDDYSCYSCGILKLSPKKGCYVDYEDRSADYPICCGKRYICRGDPRFDPKKFNDYWQNQIVG